MNAAEQLAARIKAACDSTPPKTKARNKALSEIKWTFRVANTSNTVFLSEKVQQELRPTEWLTYDVKQAAVYTGCDNEVMKQKFFEAIIGEPLELVLL